MDANAVFPLTASNALSENSPTGVEMLFLLLNMRSKKEDDSRLMWREEIEGNGEEAWEPDMELPAYDMDGCKLLLLMRRGVVMELEKREEEEDAKKDEGSAESFSGLAIDGACCIFESADGSFCSNVDENRSKRSASDD